MKKFRIVYWFNSCVTECYVGADDEDGARAKFKSLKGDKNIVSVEEVRSEV